MERKKWKKTMTALQEKIIFDANKCRTHRFGTADLFDCLAEQQYLICGYALPFGNGQFCTHPQHRGRSLLKNCARISRSIIRSLIHRLAEMFDDHFWIAILIKPFAKLEVRHFVVIYDDHYETPPHTVLLTRKRLHS